jgi:hypothetical protein
MYPYPSGDLHVGHLRNYTYIDLITRYKMMQGYNVLSPMGWDSFGLPAENRAIETGVHPRESVEGQIKAMKRHFAQLGAGFDWSRELASHWPSYYRWDQWLFLELFDRGLAYKQEAPVNWCPNDQTVLANEQVVDGCCERCGAEVEKRNLAQWFFKITDYADRLLDDLDMLDEWPDRVRTMQRNWIGRSHGASFTLQVDGTDHSFEVFTTRPDTIFGMTFAVLSPEHPLVEELIAGSSVEEEARAYIKEAGRATEIERMSEGDKTGVFIEHHALNPVNGLKVPLYIADYVLMGYGTGAIMAVPGQDQRDWDFATKYGIDIIRTVGPGGDLADLPSAILGIADPDRDLPGLRSCARPGGPIAGDAAQRRGIRAEGSVTSRRGRGVGGYVLSGLWGRRPAWDRHYGHLRRLIVVFLQVHRPGQRGANLRPGKSRLLDAGRSVHRRRRARGAPPSVCAFRHQVPLRYRPLDCRGAVQPPVHPGDDHPERSQDVEVERQRDPT